MAINPVKFYKGIYKSLTMLEIEDNNIPVILTVLVEHENSVLAEFRSPKTSYQTFRKAVITKIQPFFGADIGNIEMQESTSNKVINSETELQRAIS